MGILDTLVRPEPVQYKTPPSLDILRINMLSSDIRRTREKVTALKGKRELLEKQREEAVGKQTEAQNS